jgi:FMN phosphatase YigB (HAD superfamily)
MIRSQWRHLPSLAAERRYRRLLRRRLALNTANTPAKTVTQEFSDKWYNESYLPAMVRVIARHYKAELWVQPLLDDCHTRRIKVALLSDYEAAEDKLRVLHLNPDDFDCILSTGDLGTIKPDPSLGDMLLRHLYPAGDMPDPFPWQHALFIGDRQDTDGMLAHALGAQFMQV